MKKCGNKKKFKINVVEWMNFSFFVLSFHILSFADFFHLIFVTVSSILFGHLLFEFFSIHFNNYLIYKFCAIGFSAAIHVFLLIFFFIQFIFDLPFFISFGSIKFCASMWADHQQSTKSIWLNPMDRFHVINWLIRFFFLSLSPTLSLSLSAIW